jgi:hypothetical protein
MSRRSGLSVPYISVKRVPSTRTERMPKPRATSWISECVCCSCGTLMA